MPAVLSSLSLASGLATAPRKPTETMVTRTPRTRTVKDLSFPLDFSNWEECLGDDDLAFKSMTSSNEDLLPSEEDDDCALSSCGKDESGLTSNSVDEEDCPSDSVTKDVAPMETDEEFVNVGLESETKDDEEEDNEALSVPYSVAEEDCPSDPVTKDVAPIETDEEFDDVGLESETKDDDEEANEALSVSGNESVWVWFVAASLPVDGNIAINPGGEKEEPPSSSERSGNFRIPSHDKNRYFWDGDLLFTTLILRFTVASSADESSATLSLRI
jgi:hypothetical protein